MACGPPDGLATIAGVLRGSQADLVARSGRADLLAQAGGATLPDPFPLRLPGPGDAAYPHDGEPVIETFVVDRGGALEATGPDPAIGRWWRPEVEALVARVRAAVAAVGIELVEPINVTASATPLHGVVSDPHLDDDQPRPDDGVGLVAIAATHLGPRLAVDPVPCRPVRPPVPVELAPEAVERFGTPGRRPGGPVTLQQAPAERIVVFPRFGQLHSGPVLPAGTGVRNLLVLRAGTRPI